MATFKHINSKNADYGAAEQYPTFEHDEFTMNPTLDENGRLILRDDYRISSLNCSGEDFAIGAIVKTLCRVLQVNRSTYYKHFSSEPALRIRENHHIASLIPHIYADYNK